MTKYLALFLILLSACGKDTRKHRPEVAQIQVPQDTQTVSIYDFKLNSLSGKEVSLADFKGKKLLLVNTASECGYTPQYEDLQKLHEEHGDKVTILGFPANNFGGQEPGSNSEIAEFCKLNYGVTFPMFEKISVAGDDQHELYKWLSDKSLNGWNEESPSWNFCKYLINEKGELVKFYGSKVTPFDPELLAAIGAK